MAGGDGQEHRRPKEHADGDGNLHPGDQGIVGLGASCTMPCTGSKRSGNLASLDSLTAQFPRQTSPLDDSGQANSRSKEGPHWGTLIYVSGTQQAARADRAPAVFSPWAPASPSHLLRTGRTDRAEQRRNRQGIAGRAFRLKKNGFHARVSTQ